MCLQTGPENFLTGSTFTLWYSDALILAARPNPPTYFTSFNSVILNQLKSPKSTQNASGCCFKYLSLAFSLSSSFSIFSTEPTSVARAASGLMPPLSAQKSDALLFFKRSLVCEESCERANIGKPAVEGVVTLSSPSASSSSIANAANEPTGYDELSSSSSSFVFVSVEDAMVDKTPPPVQLALLTSVLHSAATDNRRALCACNTERIFSKVLLFSSSSLSVVAFVEADDGGKRAVVVVVVVLVVVVVFMRLQSLLPEKEDKEEDKEEEEEEARHPILPKTSDGDVDVDDKRNRRGEVIERAKKKKESSSYFFFLSFFVSRRRRRKIFRRF